MMNNMNMNNMNMGMNGMNMGMNGMNPMMMNNMNGMNGMNPMMMNNMNGMNPMMMNNMNMMNMNGMNPMMMNNMNMMNMMNMNGMNMGMNMMNMNQNMNMGDAQGWNIIFEEKSGNARVNITLSSDKKVIEAINLYKLKANRSNEENIKFIFNGKTLATELSLSQAGLTDNAVITVIGTQNVKGA